MEQEKPTLGERTRRVTSQAQQKAGEQVRSGIDSGRRQAAGALHGVAESLLHGSGEQADGAARYIQQAGEQVRRAADWLETADVEELTHRTEEFARRQPAVFIGGAFALGLIAARFIKSSSRAQYQEQQQQFSPSETGEWRPAPFGDIPAGGMNAGGMGASGGTYGAQSSSGYGTPGIGGSADLSTSGYGDASSTSPSQAKRDGGL